MASAGDAVPVLTHERLSGNPHAGGYDASTLARHRQLFGPQAVLVFPYEWLRMNPVDFVGRIRVHCGRPPLPEDASIDALDGRRSLRSAPRRLGQERTSPANAPAGTRS